MNLKNKDKFYKKAINYLLELIKFEKASNRIVTIDIKELKDSQNSYSNSLDIQNTLKSIFPMSEIVNKDNIFSNYFTLLTNWDYWYENKDLDILTPSVKNTENKMFNFNNPITISNTNVNVNTVKQEINNNKNNQIQINEQNNLDLIPIKTDSTKFQINNLKDTSKKLKLSMNNISDEDNTINNNNKVDECENQDNEMIEDNDNADDNDINDDNYDYKYNENEMTSRNKINNLLDKFTTKDKPTKNNISIEENQDDENEKGYIRKKVYCYPNYTDNNVLDIDDFDENDLIIILLENKDMNTMYIWKKEEFEDQDEFNNYIENVKKDFFSDMEDVGSESLPLDIIEEEHPNESDDFLRLL